MSTEDLVPRLRDIAESEAVRGFMVAEDLAAIRAAADALEDAAKAEAKIADALAWMNASRGRLGGHPLRRILAEGCE